MVLIDDRPRPVDALVRGGNAFTLTIESPDDPLTGRTFTSTLDGDSLTVTVVDSDTMTIVATQAQTDAIPSAGATWLLLEDLGNPNPDVILQGTWVASDGDGAATGLTVSLGASGATLTVDPSGVTQGTMDAAIAAHNDVDLSDGSHSDFAAGGALAFQRLTANAGVPTGNASLATAGNGDWAGILMPAGVDSGVSFSQSWPVPWILGDHSWGFVPLAAGSPRDVRWRVAISRVNTLGFAGDLITDPPQIEVFVTVTARNQFVMDHVFNTPNDFDLHNSDAVIGEVVSIHLQRLGSRAEDDYLGDVLVTNFSVNRAS